MARKFNSHKKSNNHNRPARQRKQYTPEEKVEYHANRALDPNATRKQRVFSEQFVKGYSCSICRFGHRTEVKDVRDDAIRTGRFIDAAGHAGYLAGLNARYSVDAPPSSLDELYISEMKKGLNGKSNW